MAFTEIGSFVCNFALTRLVLRTRAWFTVIAAGLVGNAVTNVLPAGDVAGAGVQYQMLAIGGIEADRAASGLAASSLMGLAALLMLPVFVMPAILSGVPVSPDLVHAAYLGVSGFVLIAIVATLLLATDRPLRAVARWGQVILNLVRRRHRVTDLPSRLLTQRNQLRGELGRRWWEAGLLVAGRIGLDYGALLAALRATGARPNPSLVLLAYAATAVIALVPLTPGGIGIVEASLSGLLVLAGVPSASAIVATLAYRLVTYWLPIITGIGFYVSFRSRFGPVLFRARTARNPLRHHDDAGGRPDTQV